MTGALIRWERARQAIAEAKSVDEVKDIRDKAEAMRAYARQCGETLETQNELAEIRLRAERRLGEMLHEMDKNTGGRAEHESYRSHDATTKETPPTLADIGLSKSQSSRYQLIADIPEEKFEGRIREIKEHKGELTTTSILRVARELKGEKLKADLEEIAEREIEKPTGEYDVIVIDPPWPMQKIQRDVRPNQTEFDYPTMTEDELAALALPAAADCHVWVWATHKFLPVALRLLDAWDLNYVATFVWHKPGGFQPVGLPQYNCEFALYARRGSPRFIDTKAFYTCFEAPRGDHSEKPEAFYEMVRRVTAGRRLDMFNRRPIAGFVGWGKEAA